MHAGDRINRPAASPQMLSFLSVAHKCERTCRFLNDTAYSTANTRSLVAWSLCCEEKEGCIRVYICKMCSTCRILMISELIISEREKDVCQMGGQGQ